MKRFLTITLVAAGLAAAAHAQTIRQRQHIQQHRIVQGVRSGELTRAEVFRAERSEAALQRRLVRDRIEGGGLTLPERVRIQARQNRLSNQIYRLKHNGRTR